MNIASLSPKKRRFTKNDIHMIARTCFIKVAEPPKNLSLRKNQISNFSRQKKKILKFKLFEFPKNKAI